jgi:hypothetical protein
MSLIPESGESGTGIAAPVPCCGNPTAEKASSIATTMSTDNTSHF